MSGYQEFLERDEAMARSAERRQAERDAAIEAGLAAATPVTCAHCGSTRAAVESDGIYLAIKDPVCCETEAANA